MFKSRRSVSPRMFALNQECDYNGHMIRTLRESKARLSELVELASRGQDVLISVRGKVKARITSARSNLRGDDRASWISELRSLRSKTATRKTTLKVEKILEDMREERI